MIRPPFVCTSLTMLHTGSWLADRSSWWTGVFRIVPTRSNYLQVAVVHRKHSSIQSLPISFMSEYRLTRCIDWEDLQ
jgi:hypothetical protein